MKQLVVDMQEDALEREAAVRHPVDAIAELIWNALDAEADSVTVTFDVDGLDRITQVTVSDDGLGMTPQEVNESFRKFGGSWKRSAGGRTRGAKRRAVHGQNGRGRYKAFAIADCVSWRSTAKNADGELIQSEVRALRDSLKRFAVQDPIILPGGATGTRVVLTEVREVASRLRGPDCTDALVQLLALDLMRDPAIRIVYDGVLLDSSTAIAHSEEHPLQAVLPDESSEGDSNPSLAIIEWRKPKARRLYLCDETGFVRHEYADKLPPSRESYTGYVRSRVVRELDDDGRLLLEEMVPALAMLVERAKVRLKEYVRARADEASLSTVQQWKLRHVYPFEGEAKNLGERVTRDVFDVLATRTREVVPELESGSDRSVKLTLRLLRDALETDAGSLKRILDEVLGLPAREREQLSSLLERTTLSRILSASREVSERLLFLDGLADVVFNHDLKQATKERKHLHKLLEGNAWLFGEQYHLAASDVSLDKLLLRHREILAADVPVRRKVRADAVRVEDGGRGIIDLAFAASVPMPRADEHEFLIVELKRPNVKISSRVLAQVKEYAAAVSRDPQFNHTSTKWVFWAVSTDFDPTGEAEAKQSARSRGLVQVNDLPATEIWAKTWGEIINDARARLQLFQSRLEMTLEADAGLKRLRELYANRLPNEAIDRELQKAESA